MKGPCEHREVPKSMPRACTSGGMRAGEPDQAGGHSMKPCEACTVPTSPPARQAGLGATWRAWDPAGLWALLTRPGCGKLPTSGRRGRKEPAEVTGVPAGAQATPGHTRGWPLPSWSGRWAHKRSLDAALPPSLPGRHACLSSSHRAPSPGGPHSHPFMRALMVPEAEPLPAPTSQGAPHRSLGTHPQGARLQVGEAAGPRELGEAS